MELKFRADSDEFDEHTYWEIDLGEMTATLWMERMDDDWHPTAYPLRREEGRWQYYEDDARWKARVAGLADHVRQQKQLLSPQQFPGSTREWVEDALEEGAAWLSEARNAGPGWRDLPNDVSAIIEKRWTAAKE